MEIFHFALMETQLSIAQPSMNTTIIGALAWSAGAVNVSLFRSLTDSIRHTLGVVLEPVVEGSYLDAGIQRCGVE